MQQTVLSRVLVKVIASTAAFICFQNAGAATLGLTSVYPDVTTGSASIDYAFTDICFDDGTKGGDGTMTGACGTSTGGGNSKITYEGALSEADSFGVFTIAKSGTQTMQLEDGGTTIGLLSSTYSLTANFDGSGAFTDGSVSINYTSAAGGPAELDGGLLLSGDLSAFGFGGTGTAFTFDMTFDNLSGDLLLLVPAGTDQGGLITIGSGWDSGTLGDLNDFGFQDDFGTLTANVDTFVPIPAAVWLFGSGLMGLFGVARVRKTKQSA